MGSETEADWIRCPYFGFWDVPRNLLFPYEGKLFQLDSPFEEERDDYRPAYYVWQLDDISLEQAELLSPMQRKVHRIRQWADLPVEALEFDPNRERQDGRFHVRVRFNISGLPFPKANLSSE